MPGSRPAWWQCQAAPRPVAGRPFRIPDHWPRAVRCGSAPNGPAAPGFWIRGLGEVVAAGRPRRGARSPDEGLAAAAAAGRAACPPARPTLPVEASGSGWGLAMSRWGHPGSCGGWREIISPQPRSRWWLRPGRPVSSATAGKPLPGARQPGSRSGWSCSSLSSITARCTGLIEESSSRPSKSSKRRCLAR